MHTPLQGDGCRQHNTTTGHLLHCSTAPTCCTGWRDTAQHTARHACCVLLPTRHAVAAHTYGGWRRLDGDQDQSHAAAGGDCSESSRCSRPRKRSLHAGTPVHTGLLTKTGPWQLPRKRTGGPSMGPTSCCALQPGCSSRHCCCCCCRRCHRRPPLLLLLLCCQGLRRSGL
jgi:hypothetical protein